MNIIKLLKRLLIGVAAVCLLWLLYKLLIFNLNVRLPPFDSDKKPLIAPPPGKKRPVK